VISGRIVEREALRYTPGGLPIVRFRIEHQSMVTEAGSEREVMCRDNAVAIGEIARQVPDRSGEEAVAVRGFLCRSGLNDDRLVLHVEAIRTGDPASPDNV
jgi:primosomal replication protein N